MTSDLAFETERIRFECIQKLDSNVFKAVYSDPEAVRWVGDGSPISEQECEQWTRVTRENYRKRGYGMLKAFEKTSNALIGCCGIVHPGGQIAPEIKYCLLKHHWGKGYGTELVKGLLHYGVSQLQIESFAATVAPENAASQKVLSKCGFTLGSRLTEEDGSETLAFYYGDPKILSQL